MPAIASLKTINPLIDNDLPFRFAVEPVSLRENAILAVSSAGWGGVNSHVVLTPPPAGMLKPIDMGRTRRVFLRETLRAPRTGEHVSVDRSLEDQAYSRTLATIMLCASDSLGIPIDVNTDLRARGLDSKTFLKLSGDVKKTLGGSSLR